MLYCQHCEKRIDEDMVFCPKCGEVLIEEDGRWQDCELQGEFEEAKDRANMYIVLAAVLVTLGIIGGCLFFVSSSLLGIFGIVLVCLGIGCTAAAYRHEHRARSLRNQLSGNVS
jgi:protein-S-isoprenylcysteine O-methyltransferase Ste14